MFAGDARPLPPPDAPDVAAMSLSILSRVIVRVQCSEENECQMKSKRNETFGSDLFGTNVIQGIWSGREPTEEAATRVPGAPFERPPTYFFLLYIPMCPETIEEHHEKLFSPS
ncbi:hypothetical protein VPH35_129490 [Triticum aestivum]